MALPDTMKNIRCTASIKAVETLKQLKAKTGINQNDILSLLIENLSVDIGLLILAPALDDIQETQEKEKAAIRQARVAAMQVEVRELMIKRLEELDYEALKKIKICLASSKLNNRH